MRKSKNEERYMIHDDSDIYDVSQLTSEQRKIYDSLPNIHSEEDDRRILAECLIAQ